MFGPQDFAQKVTVGVNEEATEDALSYMMQEILRELAENNVEDNGIVDALKDMMTPELVESIMDALKNNEELTVSATVKVNPLTEGNMTEGQIQDNESIQFKADELGATVAKLLDLTVGITTFVGGEKAAEGVATEVVDPIIFAVALVSLAVLAMAEWKRKMARG